MKHKVTIHKSVTVSEEIEVEFPFFRTADFGDYPSPATIHHYAVISPELCWVLSVTYEMWEGGAVVSFELKKDDNRHSADFIAGTAHYQATDFKAFQDAWAKCAELSKSFALATGLETTPVQT